jgi:hypothetical protein
MGPARNSLICFLNKNTALAKSAAKAINGGSIEEAQRPGALLPRSS